MVAASVSFAAADDLRVRIAWGGGEERAWRGTFSVRDGGVATPEPLGMEADEPGSMWLDADARGDRAKLVFRQRSPHAYDGVDLTVSAASGAKLALQFSAADRADRDKMVEIPLASLAGEPIIKEIDDRGNRVLVMRSPGDSLRVRFSRDHLVFSPGETFAFTVGPHGIAADGGKIRIKVQLLGGGKEIWSRQEDVVATDAAPIAMEIPLPNEEGVYDVAITASNSPNWSQAVRQPLNWRRILAERRVQLVVLRPHRPTAARADREFAQIVEIDPTNPRWHEKLNRLPQFAKTRLPKAWKGSLGNDCLAPRRHPLGDLAELKPNAEVADVSWEAYWLPIGQPGRPHILEVDYPSDVPQTLGISILEPTASGAMAPLTVDSGVDCGDEVIRIDEKPQWLRHRVVFWPRTSSPLLLMSNGRRRSPAVYGKIRVLAGGERLPQAMPERPAANRRLLAAYLDRPLFAETFAAEECFDPPSGRTLHDWRTFYEGGSRLVEYLHYAGYNGLMLAAAADGAAIYPSARLEPTPRYDTGTLLATAQDPVRKDVLEMLLRLFDREGLQLIPMVEFASPLPELEAIRRAGGTAAEGIEWIGADGASWCDVHPSPQGSAPYYNILHPRVQQAMLDVLRELASRYARHPAMTGLAVRLSADGYAQLPGPDWGLDDATIARFQRETDRRVPGKGPRRFAERAAFFAEEPNRRVWLEWRAAKLAHFYRRAADELAAIRPDGRLYLAGAGMIGGPSLDAELRPSLPRQTNVAAALLRVGIDARLYRDDSRRIVLLRPERIVSRNELSSCAADLEISQMADIDRYFQNSAVTGGLFFHVSREVRIDSFDRKNPFKPCRPTWLSQPAVAGEQNRRRFAHSLATLDAQVMLDGGASLPLGEEDSLRNVAAAYRALPAVHFQRVGEGEGGDNDAQPVTFRTSSHGGRTYVYAVNDAPFPVTARLHLAASPNCHIEELTGLRKIEPLRPDSRAGQVWEVALSPYDLIAAQLSEPDVVCSNPRVAWSEAVERALGVEVRRLGARAAALRNPSPLAAPANAGFESAAAADNPIPDWAVTHRGGVRIQLDTDQKRDGRQSVRMVSDGATACLVSRPFDAPPTGRLSVAVWLRIADVAAQPPLRLAVEGKLHGRDYYRFAPVGRAPSPGQPPVPLATEWGQYLFQVDDLPLDGLTSLRIRFDLMGPGEVWVDDVQAFSLAFSKTEMVELSKLITQADVKLQNGRVGDCLRLLEGYWPRFLEENVSLPPGALPPETVAADAKAVAKKSPAEEKPPERSGWLNRMKDMLPDSLRF